MAPLYRIFFKRSLNFYAFTMIETRSTHSPSHLDKFWAHVTVFGTLWGGLELTLGTFLHVLHVPKTGLIMVTLSVILLIAQRRIFPARGSTICTGVVAAFIKSLSPGGIIAGPIFGIMSEAIIVELCLLISSQRLVFSVWASVCAITWSQVQSLFKMWIYYGKDFIDALARVVEKFFRVEWTATLGWTLLAAFFGIVATIGAVAGVVGARMGNHVRRDIDARYRDVLASETQTTPITFDSNAPLATDSNAPFATDSNAQNNAKPVPNVDFVEKSPFATDSNASDPSIQSLRKRKRPIIDNTQVLRYRLIVLPFAIATLIAQFSGDLVASSIALAVWIVVLAIGSRAILRAIWWPKFWVATTIISVLSGILIAWKLDGAWQWYIGLQATARMMIRGIYVFSLISWITRALRPQECLSVWERIHLPQLGLAITRAYALLPAWNDKLHLIVKNRPSNRRNLWSYARENIITCLVEASIQTENIRLEHEKQEDNSSIESTPRSEAA